MSDDAVEMRIRAWASMPDQPRSSYFVVRVANSVSLLFSDYAPGMWARVDGGDPGDEAPWSERDDFPLCEDK